jgi:uncharacterized protein
MKNQKWMILIVLLTLTASAFATEYPKATDWVNDYAGVLTTDQKNELGWLVKDFETATTNQIFVCIMSKLPADTALDEYVNELYARWKPGQSGKDNGALLAIFINDRVLRVETGYGLEDKLTDAQSKLIIANNITPGFKQGNYYQGIKNGLIEMMRTIQPGYQPKIGTTQTTSRESSGGGFDMGTLFIIIIIVILVSNMFSRRGRGINKNILMFILGMLFRSNGWSSGHHHHSSHASRPGSGGFRPSSSRPKFSGGGGGRSGGGGASGRW